MCSSKRTYYLKLLCTAESLFNTKISLILVQLSLDLHYVFFILLCLCCQLSGKGHQVIITLTIAASMDLIGTQIVLGCVL